MIQKTAFVLPVKQPIEGVVVHTLKPIVDERGYLMEMLRSDDPNFLGFGQTYLTAVNEDVVKAWHYHEYQTDQFICVHGLIKLVLYDCREGSPHPWARQRVLSRRKQPAAREYSARRAAWIQGHFGPAFAGRERARQALRLRKARRIPRRSA